MRQAGELPVDGAWGGAEVRAAIEEHAPGSGWAATTGTKGVHVELVTDADPIDEEVDWVLDHLYRCVETGERVTASEMGRCVLIAPIGINGTRPGGVAWSQLKIASTAGEEGPPGGRLEMPPGAG